VWTADIVYNFAVRICVDYVCVVIVVLCRALGQLPRLRIFNINESNLDEAASLLKPPTSHCLLPLLPIRQFRFRGDCSHDILSLLVMWTRLPHASSKAALPSCKATSGLFNDQEGSVRFDVQPTSTANRGWLAVLLHNQVPITFYISQDSNLGSLLPDLKQYTQPLVLTLESKVEPEELGEVLAAYSGEQLTLTLIPPPAEIADIPTDADHYGHWETAMVPKLTDQHLQAMLPHVAKLRSLELSNCAELSAASVQEVVEGVGDGLTSLCLSGAQNVSDCNLWALLRSCRKLQKLELSGAPSVTEAGLAPLLVCLQPSFSAELCGTAVDWGKLQQQVEGQAGCCRFDNEGVQATPNSSTLVKVFSSPK
jgi:hypothetical protein